MTTAIDLFCGMGGFSKGAIAAGIRVLWAANHWQTAIDYHAANCPDTTHVCQDLQQADWSKAPSHDVLLASPCCQGHSPARGKEHGNPQHDASRSTAWAVVTALEYHRPYAAVVENVKQFTEWALYPAWTAALQALGYQVAPHLVDCADLGVPQNRVRIFIVCTRSRSPLMLNLQRQEHVPASSFINFDTGKWSVLDRPGRAIATLARAASGRKRHGDRFLMPYYSSGSGLTGRSLARPIGTITTRDRWALVDGDKVRMITADEVLASMTFPSDTARPEKHTETVHLAGNAVPPLAAKRVLEALQAAA